MAASDVLLNHAFFSPYLDGPDATKLQPSAWNAALLVSGGVVGELLTRDPASPTGASWLDPATLLAGAAPLAHTHLFADLTISKADLGLGLVENVALSTYVLGDGQLSANVPLKNGANVFAALQTFNGGAAIAGVLTTNVDALAAVSTDGFAVQNTTPATAGVTAQISPRVRLRGTAWNTAASKTVDWWVEHLPVTLATPYSTLRFGFQLEGAAATFPLTVNSFGSLIALGSLSGVQVSAPAFRTISAGTTAGTALASESVTKSVTVADAVATPTITVTVPNAAHGAVVRVTLRGTLGAGGALGASEATAAASYTFAVARRAGLATVVTASAAYGSAAAAVAGAATITMTAAPSTITGAVGATQTFTVNVTISRGSGASTSHNCQVSVEVLNQNASGITVS